MVYEWGPLDYLAQWAIGWTGFTLAVVLAGVIVWIIAEAIFSESKPKTQLAKKGEDDGIVAL